MSNAQILSQRNAELYTQVEKVLNSATEAKRVLSASEKEQVANFTAEIKENESSIKLYESVALGKAALNAAVTAPFVTAGNAKAAMKGKQTFSADYCDSFFKTIANKKFTNAALGEGGTTDGGNLVPTIGPNGEITALAPFEATMRQLALVIPTTNDIKFAAQSVRSVAVARASDSRASDVPFTQTAPAFAQKTLGAHMSGAFVEVTIELAQDVPAVSIFLPADLARGVNNYEEDQFINGSGSGSDCEGILTGGTAALTEALSADACLDLTGELNPFYYKSAEWVMHRLTAISLKKKQLDANQFNPYFTSVNGVDYLHGWKINYSHAMPVYSASPSVEGAIVFGDYKAAMVIGDRGGPALQVVTDNITRLEDGVIRVYGYRRCDSRVRLPEAAQILTING